MPVPSSFTDLDPVAANNSPPGTESAKGNVDNYFRAHAALIRQNYDSVNTKVAKAGDTMTGLLKLAKGANIASAATVNLSTATGNTVHITGTTAITAFTMSSGQVMDVIFDGILTLTHHATNNKLPGGQNITTAAGDMARYFYDGTTVYCLSYTRASNGAFGSVGVDQTWQDMKASRAMATTYTNSTGKPIQVSVSASSSITTSIIATVSGVEVARHYQGVSGNAVSLSVIVPNGGTYQFTIGGTATIINWAELR